MLSYAGRGTYSLERIDLNELLEDSKHLLSVSVPTSVVLRIEPSDSAVVAEADTGQLRQALMNLLTNAAEAVEDHDQGTIIIRTGAVVCDAACIEKAFLYGEVAEGPHVFFSVADDGPGIDPAARDRLFDPFFSTKHTGRGLGLAAVLGIVRGHGGMVRVDSEPGSGSKFTVLLPEAPVEDREDRDAERDGASRAAGEGKVLVVDDEEVVLDVTRQMLERLGFHVLVASGGEQALEIFDSEGGDISLVFLDLVMPEMDGSEVFRRLRERDARVHIVLCSGYNEERVADQLGGQKPAAFIQKPFDFPSLRSTVERVTSGSPPKNHHPA